jgi:hypothetical protein
MEFDLTVPCSNCPFRKEGGIPLRPGRIRELGGMMLHPQGGTFSCHKTVEYGGEGEGDEPEGDDRNGDEGQHCAGALAFALKQGKLPQLARIMERLGAFDGDAILAASGHLVWDSIGQWLRGRAVPARGRTP